VSQVEKEMKKTLMEAFKKTDDEFLKEATKMYVLSELLLVLQNRSKITIDY
jgi:hypothetical protein